MGVSCRICGAKTEKSGHLFTCQNKACGGAHWDKGKIKTIKKALKADPELLKQVLNDANVPEPIKGGNSHFVYVLRLKR